MPDAVSSTTVIRGLHDLHDRHGEWPTADEVAVYLRADPADVGEHLRALERQRLFQGRRRRGEIRWMAWGDAA